MNRRTLFWMLWVATLLVPLGAALAKGPVDMVTIVGPGLDGEVRIEDSELIQVLSITQFEDLEAPIDAPVDAGPAYEITRFFDVDGNYVAFDRVRYHPATEGRPGTVYYVGLENGGSEYDGRWFLVTPEGEQAMQAILSAGSVQKASGQSAWGTLGLLAAAVFLGWLGSRLFPVRQTARRSGA